MSRPTTVSSPEFFLSFGDLLKHLRLRSQLTQRELAITLGYNHAHLSRLEHNQRLPDAATVLALFVPALSLEDEPAWAARLVALAAAGRGDLGGDLIAAIGAVPGGPGPGATAAGAARQRRPRALDAARSTIGPHHGGAGAGAGAAVPG